MKKKLIYVNGCGIGTVAVSSLMLGWTAYFFIFTCCVCILLVFYVCTSISDILILLATSTSNKWIVYQNKENNVTPINPCLTSYMYTRFFDMFFLIHRDRTAFKELWNKRHTLQWNTLSKEIFYFFLFALTYYDLVQMIDFKFFVEVGFRIMRKS